MRRKLFGFCVIGAFFSILCTPVNASYLEALDIIRSTGYTIQTVNNTFKSATGTVEYAQRFGDRQGERRQMKRDSRNAEYDQERAYYAALQDSEEL